MSRRLIAPAPTAPLLSAGSLAAQDAPTGHKMTGPDLSTLGGAFSASAQGPEGTDHGTITVQPTPSGISLVTLALTDLPPGVLGVHRTRPAPARHPIATAPVAIWRWRAKNMGSCPRAARMWATCPASMCPTAAR